MLYAELGQVVCSLKGSSSAKGHKINVEGYKMINEVGNLEEKLFYYTQRLEFL